MRINGGASADAAFYAKTRRCRKPVLPHNMLTHAYAAGGAALSLLRARRSYKAGVYGGVETRAAWERRRPPPTHMLCCLHALCTCLLYAASFTLAYGCDAVCHHLPPYLPAGSRSNVKRACCVTSCTLPYSSLPFAPHCTHTSPAMRIPACLSHISAFLRLCRTRLPYKHKRAWHARRVRLLVCCVTGRGMRCCVWLSACTAMLLRGISLSPAPPVAPVALVCSHSVYAGARELERRPPGTWMLHLPSGVTVCVAGGRAFCGSAWRKAGGGDGCSMHSLPPRTCTFTLRTALHPAYA